MIVKLLETTNTEKNRRKGHNFYRETTIKELTTNFLVKKSMASSNG
jgi:hypothetical protein